MASHLPPEFREINGGERPPILRHYGTRQATGDVRTPVSHSQLPYAGRNFIDIPIETSQPTAASRSPVSPVSTLQATPTRAPSPNASTTPLNAGPSTDDPFLPPLARASTTFYDRILTDWWWWELFSWLVAFACVAAIVGVLAFYNGKKQPDFIVPGVTLNAFVSIFAAIAKAALILPVSEAIGQLKWMWFEKEAKLWDFYTFDGASRGPWGSLMLLGSTKCRHLVSLGASITLLALAFEPFFQQIVTFSSRDTLVGSSTVSVAESYYPFDDQFYIVDPMFTQRDGLTGRSMKLAVSSMTTSMNQTVSPPPSACPSGQCNWTEYSSLGVCHTCHDVSNLLTYFCKNHTTEVQNIQRSTMSNPCGYTFNNTFITGRSNYGYKTLTFLTTIVVGDLWMTAQNYTWNSTAFQDVKNPILDFYIGYTPGGGLQSNSTPVLKECLLQWCVKSYRSIYENGAFQEKVATTYTPQAVPSLDSPFDINAANSSFRVMANTTDVLVSAFRASLPIWLHDNQVDALAQMPGMWNFLQTSPYDVDPYLTKIADAMTNNMRSQANGTKLVRGQAWAKENFVNIRWVWIILPGVLLFATLIFVCTTIFKARKHDSAAWKSSALASLLYGLTEEGRNAFPPQASQSETEAMAHKIRVKLAKAEGGTRLVVV